MTEPRDAAEVWDAAWDAWAENDCSAAAAIIKADRAAVEAEVEAATIAKVVAWLRSLQNNGSANQAFAVAIRHACAKAIEAGEWKQ